MKMALLAALMSLALIGAVVPAQAGVTIKDVPQTDGPAFGPAIGPELTTVDGPGR